VRLRRIAPLIAVFAAVTGPAGAETREAVTIPIGGGALAGVLFAPDKTPAPAVLVLHTAYGKVEPADESYAKSLRGEGFVALAVSYVEGRRGGLWSPEITDRLARVADWLAARPEAGGKPMGAVGFSLGAHVLSLSARDPRIAAVVVYYGAYDVRAAKGIQTGPNVRLPIDVASEVNASTLLLHGEADDEIPLSVARSMQRALQSAGKRVELVTYPNAHHRFDRGPNDRMSGETSLDGHTYRYDAVAATDAWKRTLAFLRAHLGD
jgi:carboxymethylenebutenolidase